MKPRIDRDMTPITNVNNIRKEGEDQQRFNFQNKESSTRQGSEE